MPTPTNPNAAILAALGGNRQSAGGGYLSADVPYQTEEESFLDSLVGEEDLYAQQDAIAERGRASGGAYAIPSRQDLRKSARSTVARQLAPLRIEQQGARERAAIQAQGQQDAMLRFLLGEQGKDRRAEASNAADIERVLAQQNAQTERSAQTQAAMDKRTKNREAAITGRSQAAASLKRANELDKQVSDAGIWQSLLNMFGRGALPGKRAESKQLRDQALGQVANTPLPGDEDKGSDAEITPEEWAMIQAQRAGRR